MITKSRLDALAIAIAKDMPPFDLHLEPYAYHKCFALRLMKAVEQEAEVVLFYECEGCGHMAMDRVTSCDCMTNMDIVERKLIALPLVEGD